MPTASSDVCFSNRPFEVKRFQTNHHCNVDVAHGLALLFGIGTRALVWGFFVKEIWQGALFSSPVSLFDLKAVSSSRSALRSSRRAQELSRLAVAPTLRHTPPFPGHTLTASSTTAPLGAVRTMTIRGEPACGRGSIAPQPCIRWVQGPEP